MELSLSRVCGGHSSSTSPVSPISSEPSLPPRGSSSLSAYSVFTLTTPCKHTHNEIHLPLQARGDPALHTNWAPAVPHSWSSSASSRDMAHLLPEQLWTPRTEEVPLSGPPDKSDTISSGHVSRNTPGCTGLLPARARLYSLTTHN